MTYCMLVHELIARVVASCVATDVFYTYFPPKKYIASLIPDNILICICMNKVLR